MSYSISEARDIVDLFAQECEDRDGDCVTECPLSRMRDTHCPFEDYASAIDLVTGMSGYDKYAYPDYDEE